ncbi:uncharacterized protein LOC143037966 [Oratosquilla oratoria]|uniref:uncharacterized protein LOC143037966 n=1 Tax=Oratosquilla oratoria TaxID=337810 RepID=UPI003F76E6B3
MVSSESFMTTTTYNFSSVGGNSLAGALHPPPPLPFFHTSAIAAAHASAGLNDVGGGSYHKESVSAKASASAAASSASGAASAASSASLQYLTPLGHNYPTEADTLAYVDALKHSDLSEWRSLQEVANRAGGGSCSGAVTTSVLTALYLLGLFNLCSASPGSCCVPSISHRRRRRRRRTLAPSSTPRPDGSPLPDALNRLPAELEFLTSHNLEDLPHITTSEGGRVPVHISVVEKVRKLWDSNPRLLSSVVCKSPTESVRSSFISLSGVAAGIILAYSVAQLSQCYPDHGHPDQAHGGSQPDIWFFPIPSQSDSPPQLRVPSIPPIIPVPGEDEPPDGCGRDEVPLGFGRCAPLLSTAHCPYHHWLLLNHNTRMGECVPQLCPEGRIYVEADQLCHDVNEPGLCPGDQRLFMTAAGYAVCDCPDGMVQDHYGNCHQLYDQAYCDRGLVLQFHKPSGALHCDKDACGAVNNRLWEGDLPYAPRGDGYCYQFGKQGPCKGGELFGYNTKSLEATCVSLVDAGLVRPRRSFMYHRMSFPSTQDHTFPHYQVSYVIMNGTTWGLQLKSLHRSRREVHIPSEQNEDYKNKNEILFLDTREIPSLLDNMPGLHPPPPKQLSPKPLRMWPPRRHHHRPVSLRPLRRSSLFRRRRKADDTERRKKVKKLVDAMISMRRNESLSNSESRNDGDTSSNDRSSISVDSNNSNDNSFNSIGSNNSSSNSSSSSSGGSSVNSNSTGIIDDSSEKDGFNRGENSATGSGGDGGKGSSKKSKKSSGKKKSGKDKEKLVRVEQKTTSNQKDRQVDLHRDNKVLTVEQQKVALPETPVVVKQQQQQQQQSPSSHNRRRSRKHRKGSRRNRKRGRKEGGRRRGGRKGGRRRGGGKKGRVGKGRNRGRSNATTPAAAATQTRRPPSLMTPGANASLPTSTTMSPSINAGQSTTTPESKRGGKRRRKGRRQKGRKNPKLPFRVPTVFPPSEDTGPSDGDSSPSFASTTLTPTRPSSPPTDGTQDSTTTGSGKKTTTPEVVDQTLQKPTSSSEATLPEYLRHRDRRQSDSGGGIIDAPRLVKCRSGAERDYNYKCREVYVPADRDRRSSGANTDKTPSPPSIECPAGTRLDPLGKCKTQAATLFG